MEKLLKEDLWFMVYSLAYGGVLGLFYDILRILRITITPGVVIAFIQDIIFWLFSAVATFIYVFVFSNGTVRLIFLFFVALGWLMYYISIGNLVVFLWSAAVTPVKSFLRRLKRFIIRPAVPFIEKLKDKREKLQKNIKKNIKNSNFLFHFKKKNNKIYKDKYSYALRRRR